MSYHRQVSFLLGLFVLFLLVHFLPVGSLKFRCVHKVYVHVSAVTEDSDAGSSTLTPGSTRRGSNSGSGSSHWARVASMRRWKSLAVTPSESPQQLIATAAYVACPGLAETVVCQWGAHRGAVRSDLLHQCV